MSGRTDERLPSIPELSGEYLLLRELGRGGAAVVYLARDRELEREVAIKLVRTPLAGDEESRARFGREARTAALLNHPNIVGVHAVKRLQDGGLALVMQYVPGPTLKQILHKGGPLEYDRAERVLRDIAAALAYAHERGVVHRDVKPENIFIHEVEGHALLADFGIARTTESHSGITLDGMAIGTPAYMAPEHIDGGRVDSRADLYSLGMVAWEMITGEAPWEGENLYSIVYKQKHSDLPAVQEYRSDVPFHLAYVIERLTEKDRDQRFADAQSLLAALDEARTAGIWKKWLLKRGMRKPASNKRLTTPLPLTPPAPIGVVAVQGSQAHDGPPIPGGETVRYRRHGSPHLRSPEPIDAGEDADIAGVPVPSAALHPAGDVEPGTGVETAPDRHPLWSAIPADVLEEVLATSDQGKPPKRRLPLAFASAVVVLLTGVGATLFALGSAPGERDVTPTPAAVAYFPGEEEPGTPEAPAALPSEAEGGSASDVDSDADADADELEAAEPLPANETEPAAPEPPANAEEEAAASADSEPAEEAEPPASQPPRSAHRFPSRPSVSAGGFHTCTVSRNGEAYCWGGNSGGQLGNATSARSPDPTGLATTASFREVAAGFSHTCAITTSGDVMCWGANESGQLGLGSLASRTAPAAVEAPRTFETVAAGRSHTCALTAQGEAFCWGANNHGQLGDRSRSPRLGPTRVAASGFVTITAGWNHTCALTRRGSAVCWGSNGEGQLGNESTADQTAPVPVVGRRVFTRISAGGAHTCALASNGSAFCWGHNSHGQLGNGSTAAAAAPASVVASVGFAEITAGGVHTCALTRAGEAYCWGRNVYGQLGDGTTEDRNVPTRVDVAQRFASLHASGSHTCGTTPGGERYCWGYNLEGQLGDGSRTHQLRPVLVPRLQG